MDYWQAILLGILQGATEFLPVSSSGHLVIAQHLFGIPPSVGVVFETVLHAGTMLAIIVYFRDYLFKLTAGYISLIILASIPAALIGLIFHNNFEMMFGNIKLVGFTLLITGLLNLITGKIKPGNKSVSSRRGLWMGVAQAVAIIPGISRSGSTIFAGVLSGADPEEVARFSFLMSIPAVAGANLLQISKYGWQSSGDIYYYLLSFTAAFVSGLYALKLVIGLLKKKKFEVFAVYCFAIGALILLLY